MKSFSEDTHQSELKTVLPKADDFPKVWSAIKRITKINQDQLFIIANKQTCVKFVKAAIWLLHSSHDAHF